jgi:hypothetical protein
MRIKNKMKDFDVGSKEWWEVAKGVGEKIGPT